MGVQGQIILYRRETGYCTIETTPEDMAKIEELLQVSKGFFSR